MGMFSFLASGCISVNKAAKTQDGLLSSSSGQLDFPLSFTFPAASCLQIPYIYKAQIPESQDDTTTSQPRNRRRQETPRQDTPVHALPRSPPREVPAQDPAPGLSSPPSLLVVNK